MAPTLNNTIPVMKEFFFIIKTHQGYNLTDNGKNFASLLIEDDKNKIKEYAKNNLLKKSELFTEAYKILTETPDIDTKKLGEKIGKNEWQDVRTYKAVGKSCKDILDGFGLYEYKGRGVRKHRGRHTDMLLPYTSAIIIFKLLDESFVNNTWKVTQDDFSESKNIKRILYANTLLDLGIGKYIDNVSNTVELTEDGIKLKNAIDFSSRQSIFQDILMKYSPIKDILKIIFNNNYKNITQNNIGDILEKYNKVNWKPSTKESYAVKLLNWLKESNILEEIDYGQYRLSTSLIEKYNDFFSSIKKEIVTYTNQTQIAMTDAQIIIYKLHQNCNHILHSEKKEKEWYNNIELKKEILSNIESLIEIYKSKEKSTRSLEHMKDWIDTGYKLKEKKYIENCLHILVDDIE